MKEILFYEELASTNETAKEMIFAKKAAVGTVIAANAQTCGRGTHGRKFFSPKGLGIYMSVVLSPEEPSFTTISAAVTVSEAIEAVTDLQPKIKWVNDIYLRGKKVCGILAETVGEFVVLGVGINFNMREEDFPEELSAAAGSIFPDGDAPRREPPVTRERLIDEIIRRLDANAYSWDEILSRYRSRLMYVGERVRVSDLSGGAEYEAVVLGVDDGGRLVIKKDSGGIISLLSGDIKILSRG